MVVPTRCCGQTYMACGVVSDEGKGTGYQTDAESETRIGPGISIGAGGEHKSGAVLRTQYNKRNQDSKEAYDMPDQSVAGQP